MKISALIATIGSLTGMTLAILFFKTPEKTDSQFAPLLVQTPTYEYHQRLIAAPQRVRIPEAKIDLAVRSAVNVGNSYEFFLDAASYLVTSAKPGERGNMVLYAHNEAGLFRSLIEVSLGDKVMVEAGGVPKGYTVTRIKVVEPNQIDVIAQTPDERLTLLTCTGVQKSHRLVVIAEPTSAFGTLLLHTLLLHTLEV